MELKIDITGTTPLVMHNIRLANRHDPITQQIARITGKSPKQKTEQDSFDVERLEWLGGLYYDPEHGYYLESRGIIRCFQEAAKVTREGKDVQRALSCDVDKVAIEFPHKDLLPEKLWERLEYRFWAMVGIGPKRVPRMRPCFPTWSLSGLFELAPDMLDLQALVEIAERAGKHEGLFEARTLGKGRFRTVITVVKAEDNGEARGARHAKRGVPVE